MGTTLRTHVVMELLKNFSYSSERANLTYYRDSNAKEIDVIVEANGFIHPLEIKKSANPDRRGGQEVPGAGQDRPGAGQRRYRLHVRGSHPHRREELLYSV